MWRTRIGCWISWRGSGRIDVEAVGSYRCPGYLFHLFGFGWMDIQLLFLFFSLVFSPTYPLACYVFYAFILYILYSIST